MEYSVGIDHVQRHHFLGECLGEAPVRKIQLADVEVGRDMVLGLNQDEPLRGFEAAVDLHLCAVDVQLQVQVSQANRQLQCGHAASHGGVELPATHEVREDSGQCRRIEHHRLRVQVLKIQRLNAARNGQRLQRCGVLGKLLIDIEAANQVRISAHRHDG